MNQAITHGRRIAWLGMALMLLVWMGAPSSGQPADAPAASGGPPAEAETEAATEAATEAGGGRAATPQTPRGVAIASGHDIAVIPVEGMIYGFVLDSMKRRIDRALNDGATMIVLELDTPGGEVMSALDISSYLKSLQVPTVAWINDQAYSAGTMIASACDEIVMAPSSALGDSAPIAPGQNLSPTERAKAVSPILEDYRDNATTHGYDYAVFHAMTELGVEVYYVEHKDTGERRLVNQADFAVMVQGRDLDARGLGGLFGGGSGGGGSARTESGVEVKRQVATAMDRGKWAAVEQLPSGATVAQGRIHDGQSLLTLNQTRAMDIGLARAIIRNTTELRQHYNAASVNLVTQTWSEQLAGWLTHPMVKGILIIGLLLGAYVEFQSPGLGVPGAIAAICLIALLGAPFVVGLAEVWHVLLFIVGLGMLLADLIFVIGFGLLGIAGIVLMFAALVLASIPTSGSGPLPLPSAAMWDRLFNTLLFMLLGLFVSFVGLFFLTKHYGKLPYASRMILAAGTDGVGLEHGGAGSERRPESHVSGDEAVGAGHIHVGDEGRVSSTGLRPSGRATIQGEDVDVVSVGGFIDPGRKVRVREVHGNRIVVEEG